MGAKARAWLNRSMLVLGVAAGVAIVVALPTALGIKAIVLLVAAAVGTALAFRQIPAFDPLGRVHWRLPRQVARTCAITFDDGPSAETPRVLEILQRYDAKATFFVLSSNARRHPEALRMLAEGGHTVAVHGVSHHKLHRAAEADIERELSTAACELRELGVSPAALYRPPHGLKNSAVFRVTRRLGYQVWAWSRGIWDTDRPAPEVLVKRATRFACSRMVLLLHDGRGDEEKPDVSAMLAALAPILDGLRARGFRFVTLDKV
jgi:peptidoglycan/xylan/chitin deacetylase (PgdA/CDA1 family)